VQLIGCSAIPSWTCSSVLLDAMAPAVTSDTSPCAKASHLHAETVSTLPQSTDLTNFCASESVLESELAMSTVQNDATVSGNSTVTGILSCVLSGGSQVALTPVSVNAAAKPVVESSGRSSLTPEPANGIPAPSVANMVTSTACIVSLKGGQQRTLNILIKTNNGKCGTGILQKTQLADEPENDGLIQTTFNGGNMCPAATDSHIMQNLSAAKLPGSLLDTSAVSQSASMPRAHSSSAAADADATVNVPDGNRTITADSIQTDGVSSLTAADSNSFNTGASVEQINAIGARQKGIRVRLGRLLCRLRRLQTREANSFVKQQLGGLVSFLRRPKEQSKVDGAGDSQVLSVVSDYRSLSTSQLVGLVQRMQSTDSFVHPLAEGLCTNATIHDVSKHTGCTSTANKLATSLRHLEEAVDSDATESSSGGESDDDASSEEDFTGAENVALDTKV
jgi:hypothetical protein